MCIKQLIFGSNTDIFIYPNWVQLHEGPIFLIISFVIQPKSFLLVFTFNIIKHIQSISCFLLLSCCQCVHFMQAALATLQ
jgi:hypothetical protein